ncbi:MAG: CBS domain-containing protein [Candidatus Aenigmarchaeota archaeon]|nr:CBS domain-containing protein [Candidatus Aenigmarchaeota archaeon]
MSAEKMAVKDAMTRRIATISESASVQSAAELMKKWRVGSLIVIRGKNPAGIVTESDIIKKVVSSDLSAANIEVREIMTAPLKFLSPDENLNDAARKMIASKIRRMPVISKGEVVGILTHTDIVRVSPAMIDILSERAKMRESEPQLEIGSSVGLCESCGNYSEILTSTDDEWLCVDCKQEKSAEE